MQRVRGRLYSLLTLAAFAAALPLPAPLAAQTGQTARGSSAAAGPRPIRFGQDVTGTLTDADPALSGRGPFHAYRFTAKAEKRYIITLNAPDFDALVMVMREVGGITDVVATDDDGGGEMNARLRFRPQAAGSYIIVAQSLAEDGRGAYTLRINEVDPPPPPQARPLSVGQNLQGSITDESAEDDEEGFPFDVYRISGSGQRVRIVMRSEDFDTFLALKKVTASGEEEVATDDDGAGGTDSRLTVTLDGEYRLYARPLANGDRGGYTLSVEEAVAAPVTQRPIKVGDTVEGELSDADPELDEGGFFHEYVIDAAAGDNLRITLRSGEFDSYLRWGTKAGNTFTELASDDDSGGDLDSQLTVRADAAGRYVIRVSALGSGEVGPYQLSVERVTP
jgi:hypothetical protein